MTLSDINAYVTFRTGQDTTTYTSTIRLISANRWLHKIWSMLLQSMDDWQIDDPSQVNYPSISTPLIASQRDYTLPTTLKLLNIDRVDVSYNGTNYRRAMPFDINQIGTGVGNETEVDANFSKDAPGYDLRAFSIFLYPLASASDVASGGKLRVYYEREAIEWTSADLTDTTKEPPFDEFLHIMVALGMVYDWAVAKNVQQLKVDVMQELQEYEARLEQHYGRKDKDINLRLGAADGEYT